MEREEEHIHFVTGKLAEHAVRNTVTELSKEVGFKFSIDVLPITVAALMTPKWVLRHIQIPTETTRIIVPGYLSNGISTLAAALQKEAHS